MFHTHVQHSSNEKIRIIDSYFYLKNIKENSCFDPFLSSGVAYVYIILTLVGSYADVW